MRIVTKVGLFILLVPKFVFATPASIELFVHSQNDLIQSTTNENVRLHVLGELQQIEKEISKGLSANNGNVEQEALKRITPQISLRIEKGWQSHLLARQLGLTHIPAIVIDRQFVYYGTNIDKAITLWRNQK